MTTITIALDGTEFGEMALNIGARLAQRLDGSIRIAHISREPGYQPETSAVWYAREIAERVGAGLQVDVHVATGDPAEELIRLTWEHPDGILVMATHGRGAIGRLLRGSVAHRVALEGHSPVVLARDGARNEIGDPLKLLVPLDGSPLSESAIPLATELATRTGAMISLTRVVEPFWAETGAGIESPYFDTQHMAAVDEKVTTESRGYLEEIAERLRRKGLHVVWEVRTGRPADEIARLAETTAADLIVIPTHGRKGVARVALGSVVDALLQRGETPLLVVPPAVAERIQSAPAGREAVLAP